MNEIEKAIAYFEDAVRESDEIIEDCSPVLQAELIEQKGYFVVALTALREKQKREKGCEYCNNTDYIFESQQKIETPQWDEYEGGFIVIRQHINFCPMCGKRLEEHNE